MTQMFFRLEYFVLRSLRRALPHRHKDAEVEDVPPSSAKRTVTTAFESHHLDDLQLRVLGATVVLEKIRHDGWGYGHMLARPSSSGWFPILHTTPTRALRRYARPEYPDPMGLLPAPPLRDGEDGEDAVHLLLAARFDVCERSEPGKGMIKRVRVKIDSARKVKKLVRKGSLAQPMLRTPRVQRAKSAAAAMSRKAKRKKSSGLAAGVAVTSLRLEAQRFIRVLISVKQSSTPAKLLVARLSASSCLGAYIAVYNAHTESFDPKRMIPLVVSAAELEDTVRFNDLKLLLYWPPGIDMKLLGGTPCSKGERISLAVVIDLRISPISTPLRLVYIIHAKVHDFSDPLKAPVPLATPSCTSTFDNLVRTSPGHTILTACVRLHSEPNDDASVDPLYFFKS